MKNMNENLYISSLKNKNVTFRQVSEYDAMRVMHYRFPYNKLEEFFPLFETYNKGERSGQFINLDFSQLYHLAEIELFLCQLILDICLEIEISLKARLISEATLCGDSEEFFQAYISSDQEYINKAFSPGNYDIANSNGRTIDLAQMSFSEFVMNAQFGTLERVIHAFYKKHAPDIYSSPAAPFEGHLGSIRRLRNITAHNNPLLGRLLLQQEHLDLKLLALLGKEGISHRTLKTNMGRAIISDVCGLLYEYTNLCCNTTSLKDKMIKFSLEYCEPNCSLYEKADVLASSYRFMKKAVPIILKSNSRYSKLGVDDTGLL